jgi:c-di-GMP-binding flagellar brake protein YcgR
MSEAGVGGTIRAQVPTRVLDVSVGGALLVVNHPLEVGTIYDFALEVEDDTLWVQAEVRRCVAAASGADHHVGVQFVGIDPHDEERLKHYLARQRP